MFEIFGKGMNNCMIASLNTTKIGGKLDNPDDSIVIYENGGNADSEVDEEGEKSEVEGVVWVISYVRSFI